MISEAAYNPKNVKGSLIVSHLETDRAWSSIIGDLSLQTKAIATHRIVSIVSVDG